MITSEAIADLEKNFLGSMLINPAAIMPVAEKRGISKEWFTDEQAETIWEAAAARWSTSGDIDTVLLAQDLDKHANASAYLVSLIDRTNKPANGVQYIEGLAQELLKRRVQSAAHRALKNCSELGGQEALEALEAELSDIRDLEKKAYGGFKEIKDFAPAIMEDFREVAHQRIELGNLAYYHGIKLPWDILNVKYNGVTAGIHIIAARPSQGKTALAVCMSAGIRERQLFFSIDMPMDKLAMRYGSMWGQVSLPKLSMGGTKWDLERMETGLRIAQDMKNLIISNSSDVDRMVGEIHRAVRYDNVKCVWIDYLQIVSGGGNRRFGNQKEEIDYVLTKLKKTAITLNIPIFCLTQLNRESARNAENKPQLTDLGDSGAIERDAATVMILWKHPQVRRLWDEHPPVDLAFGQPSLAAKLEPMMLCLVKNQQGATGDSPFIFFKNYFLFRPGDHEGKVVEVNPKDEGGTGPKYKDYSACFETLRDDFLTLMVRYGYVRDEQGKVSIAKIDANIPNKFIGLDDYIYERGCLGVRGCPNLHKVPTGGQTEDV